MDRQIVYPGAIPLETDLLNTNKFVMTGLAKLASAILGENTWLFGLACKPTAPASMSVQVGEGQIYSMQYVDGTPYSSLAADNTITILKQGLQTASSLFKLNAPDIQGYSISYLIQVAYADRDSGSTVLPYYNAADPSIAYSGPDNNGTAQSTVRIGVCHVSLKAGIAARTGEQMPPSPDPGYTAAWVVNVENGALSVDATAINRAESAPFLPSCGIHSAIQQCTSTFADDTGTANHYSAFYSPAIYELNDGLRLTFKAREANNGACTFSASSGSAYPLYSHSHQELQGGEIVSGGLVEVTWNSALCAWLMCGSTGGAAPVSEALKPRHALSMGQADQRYFKQEQAEKNFLSTGGGEVSGNLNIKGRLVAEQILAGNAMLSDDGNVFGSRWSNGNDNDKGWLSEWLAVELKKLHDHIRKLPTSEELSKNYIKNVRLGSESKKKGEKIKFDDGYVLTGFNNPGRMKAGYEFSGRPLQIHVSGYWRTVEQEK